jgi:hypothetical protein
MFQAKLRPFARGSSGAQFRGERGGMDSKALKTLKIAWNEFDSMKNRIQPFPKVFFMPIQIPKTVAFLGGPRFSIWRGAGVSIADENENFLIEGVFALDFDRAIIMADSERADIAHLLNHGRIIRFDDLTACNPKVRGYRGSIRFQYGHFERCLHFNSNLVRSVSGGTQCDMKRHGPILG